MLADTLRQMRDDGVRNALAFVTSAYSSYSGCRQYREDIERARESVGPRRAASRQAARLLQPPRLRRRRTSRTCRAALEQIPEATRADARVAFTAHSIPKRWPRAATTSRNFSKPAASSPKARATRTGGSSSRAVAGRRRNPGSSPDICDHLRELKETGAADVVVAPVGFISDHMEVLYDLDTEARQLCGELGLNMVRAATVGTHPDFIKMIRELILERLDDETPRRALGTFPPRQDTCATDCCLPGFAARTPARPGSE